MVSEAKPRADRRASLTVSSKRQVTLPADMVRALGLQAGDKLVARIKDGSIVLKQRPKSLVEYLDSFPSGIYGATKEEIDANIAEGRRDPQTSATEEPVSQS